jgi:acetyl-CoA carboxylase beta subunit
MDYLSEARKQIAESVVNSFDGNDAFKILTQEQMEQVLVSDKIKKAIERYEHTCERFQEGYTMWCPRCIDVILRGKVQSPLYFCSKCGYTYSIAYRNNQYFYVDH